jgi:hypothetical protein
MQADLNPLRMRIRNDPTELARLYGGHDLVIATHQADVEDVVREDLVDDPEDKHAFCPDYVRALKSLVDDPMSCISLAVRRRSPIIRHPEIYR